MYAAVGSVGAGVDIHSIKCYREAVVDCWGSFWVVYSPAGGYLSLKRMCVCFSTQAHTRRVYFWKRFQFLSRFGLFSPLLSCTTKTLYINKFPRCTFCSRAPYYYFLVVVITLLQNFRARSYKKKWRIYAKNPSFTSLNPFENNAKMDMYSLTDKEKEIYREEKTVPHWTFKKKGYFGYFLSVKKNFAVRLLLHVEDVIVLAICHGSGWDLWKLDSRLLLSKKKDVRWHH